ISAAENFALAMRVLPHVTVVGDFTSGVFADVYGDRLPNGWSVSISYKKFVDCNDFCWEGIGVPMDLRIVNSKEDIDNGIDRILDFAVGLINSGGINHQNEDDSLKDIRESLAQTLDKNIEERGIEYGLREFNRKRSGDPAYWYIDRREMESLARELDRSGNSEHAIEVVKLNIQAHPEDYRTYFHLAEIYKEQGNTDLAKENYRKTLDLNRRSYPWEKEAYNTAKNFVDR
ncbi:MAG: hypothetical protein GY845_09550, partial [Planctomycetes bacterium]|nr:hypothetical protein [Planctomycetota bacterium]